MTTAAEDNAEDSYWYLKRELLSVTVMGVEISPHFLHISFF